ncbi:AMP-binding protein [Paeniroseomonas aquatica]|uniref:AMP-binding protein n=1 Tax=Paeniroseomonas aquatica TaxID=373043 RepID=UPI003606DE53
MPQLAHWAASQADKPAAIFPDTGTVLRYGRLHARARQAAHWLIGLGLQPGEGIAMLLDNRPEFLELAEAARLAGLYFTPLSIHLRPHEVGYVLADSGARLLVASPELAGLAAALVEEGALGSGCAMRWGMACRAMPATRRRWPPRIRRRRCRSGRWGGSSSIPPAPPACPRASAGRCCPSSSAMRRCGT